MNAITALREALLRDMRRCRRIHNRTDLRLYEAGDDYRYIDWNATARKGELYSRVTQTEKALTLASITDTSASMLAGRRRSVSLAAEEARQTWRCLASPDDRYVDVSNDDIASELKRVRAKLPEDTALLLISDCFGLVPTLRITSMMAKKFDCTLLFVRDPWYDGFPLRGLHRIRDIESNASRILFFGARQRERYHAAVREREDAIVDRFSSAGWRTGILTEDDGTEALASAFRIV